MKVQFKETDNAGFEITKVIANIVYGSIKPTSPTTPVSITRKFSISYMESENSRQNSGGPGYVNGMLLKTGTELVVNNDITIPPHVKEPISGFPLLGADNQGKCYSVK